MTVFSINPCHFFQITVQNNRHRFILIMQLLLEVLKVRFGLTKYAPDGVLITVGAGFRKNYLSPVPIGMVCWKKELQDFVCLAEP